MTTAMVVIADGTEEMEAVIVVDVLRRAGWEVTAAAIGGAGTITASRGVRIIADCRFDAAAARETDCLILPGGAGGTEVFRTTASLLEVLRQRHRESRWIAAICAAPLALQEAGILETQRYTCHPGVSDRFQTGIHCRDRVVTDQHLITSQGPGTTFEFALEILLRLEGAAASNAVRSGLILPDA